MSGAFRFASLGSGSEGNALVVQCGNTSILMDCGFGLNDTLYRLERLGISPQSIAGIVVTHEHGDHIAGVAKLARKFTLPVWLTHGTLRVHPVLQAATHDVIEINPHEPFCIEDIAIHPFLVPHDAAEPVQYVFSNGDKKLGVLTDTGSSTPHIEKMLNGCSALVLECNHDEDMLSAGDYPYSLKQRVGGRFGHLNNREAGRLLSRLDNSRLQHIVAAHLSRKNNSQELAVSSLSSALNCDTSFIGVATQEGGFDWREIR